MINIRLLAWLTQKIGINKLVYKIIYFFQKRAIVPSETDWKMYLSTINPDVGMSCLCKNEIAPKEERIDLVIIIPVYNTEQYIAECIESALNQRTRFTYRVIIVNDGSTDGSSDIINRYIKDERIKVIHQENRGFSGARNRALEYIDGNYVMFLDSDDRLAEGAVEKLLDKAYEGDYDIVGGGYTRFYDTKYRSKTLANPNQLFGHPWGKVYKAEIWEKVQFPNNYWFEDTVNAMIVHDYAKRITTIPDVVYDHRINRNGITSSSGGNSKVIDTLWVTIKLLNDRKALGLPFDTKFSDSFINQCKINTWRISTLGDKQANVANFLASKDLFFLFFMDAKCQKENNKYIEEAFMKDDFWQFYLACLFL